ncbi:MAG: hypothetical protein ABJH98_17655 [Reichenbachiella sp.]|uniref:hypothetical protein n=1 Tax=Reichenbachiella sp. TaxID=2184521 RepID=UPI0032998508
MERNDMVLEDSAIKVRKDLEKKLKLNRGHMWSYDPNLAQRRLSDKVIILKYLDLGSQEDLNKLKMAFPINLIERYWLRGMVYGGQNEPRQIHIAKSVFGIKRPNEYLENKRANRLKKRTQRSSF